MIQHEQAKQSQTKVCTLRLHRIWRDCCTLDQRSSDDPDSAANPIWRAEWAPKRRIACDRYAISSWARELGGMQSIAMKGISSTASTSSADTECPSPIPTTCGRQCNTFSREANDEDCPRTTHGWPNDQWRPTYVPCTPGALVFSVTQDEQLSAWRLRRESSRSSSAFKPEY